LLAIFAAFAGAPFGVMSEAPGWTNGWLVSPGLAVEPIGLGAFAGLVAVLPAVAGVEVAGVADPAPNTSSDGLLVCVAAFAGPDAFVFVLFTSGVPLPSKVGIG
jgi:hypothetical protein